MEGKKVYVLMEQYVDDYGIACSAQKMKGIFSTREKADEAKEKLDNINGQRKVCLGCHKGIEINEVTLDDMTSINQWIKFITQINKGG